MVCLVWFVVFCFVCLVLFRLFFGEGFGLIFLGGVCLFGFFGSCGFGLAFFGGVCFFPQTVVTLRGSYGKGKKGRVLIKVLALCRRFRPRRNAVLRFCIDFDCAGSREVCVSEIAISRRRFTGCSCRFSGLNFVLHGKVQGIHHMWRSET